MSLVLVLSGGGIKSAVAAARLAKDHNLIQLHLDYGQASAAAEHRSLVALMPRFPNARLMRLALPHVLELNRGVIEHSRPGVIQAAPTSSTAGKPEVVVPASLRGLLPVLLSVAVQAAGRVGAEAMALGMTRTASGTHLGLPAGADPSDLRREFLHAFAVTCDVLFGRNRALPIDAPLIDLSAAEVLQLALRLEVPLEYTWSCQTAGPKPCGTCDGCKERERAFAEIGRPDPLIAPPRKA